MKGDRSDRTPCYRCRAHGWMWNAYCDGCLNGEYDRQLRDRNFRPVGPCPCECNSGGFCGGCGHAGCGGRR